MGGSTGRVVVVGNCGSLLQFKGGLNHRCNQAAVDVPFDMAMEEPYTRIVASKSQHNVAVWMDEKCVSPHWHCRHYCVAWLVVSVVTIAFEEVLRLVISVFGITSYNGLKIVPV